jgi:hypothetical protein
MGNEVFANTNEISCKSGDGKVIACFPDVCLSPPSPPAGPIPVPYPVSSFSSDAANGSKTVKIAGKEIMLKDKSYFTKCTGDEPATKGLGMGVVSHNITGKVYYAAWSMDVKVEGLNVDRHLDLTTSNHMSPNGNTPPMVEIEGMMVREDVKNCVCKYSRPDGTPNTAQKNYVNDPEKQGDPVKCWICGSTKAGGSNNEFIADHQPSLVERWYTNDNGSGCLSGKAKFAEDANSAPEKKGDEYQELKPRCFKCYDEQPMQAADGKPLTSNIKKRRKKIREGTYESKKSSRLRKQVKKAHKKKPRKC